MKSLRFTLLLTCYVVAHLCAAQNPTLHINPKWSECSFQLDPSLTQQQWHQFTEEAGLVSYFRPLTDAKPMGGGKFEFALLQWSTAINANEGAWNNTFVHPDATHWLTEGPRLAVPGLTFRAGISKKIDVGAYWTMNPNANYGFWGGQIQYNIINGVQKRWAASARISMISMYGPDDLNFSTYGMDLIFSREFPVCSNWLAIAPYAGVSTYLANAHEKTSVVNLQDEHVLAAQGMVGSVVKISIARLAVEYNFAKISTLSFKIGCVF